MEKHVMRGQKEEYARIHALAGSAADGPVMMLNLNSYTAAAGYPSGSNYREYMDVLEATVERAGGKVLWRTDVLGQPVGCEHDRVDEILAVWYPSLQAFAELRSTEGASEMFRLREVCVDNAVLHRCPGTEAPLAP